MSQTTLSPPTPLTGKHQDILEAAVNVFAAEGFRNTDVQAIADRAGVGKGTVYRYFGNKEQLFLATARYCNEKLVLYVGGQFEGHPTAEAFMAANGGAVLLRRIACACAHFYQNHLPCLEILIQECLEFRETNDPLQILFHQNARAGLDRLMEFAVKQGEFRPGPIGPLSNAFTDMLYGSLIRGWADGGKNHLVERVDQAVEFLLSGIVVKNSDESDRLV